MLFGLKLVLLSKATALTTVDVLPLAGFRYLGRMWTTVGGSGRGSLTKSSIVSCSRKCFTTPVGFEMLLWSSLAFPFKTTSRFLKSWPLLKCCHFKSLNVALLRRHPCAPSTLFVTIATLSHNAATTSVSPPKSPTAVALRAKVLVSLNRLPLIRAGWIFLGGKSGRAGQAHPSKDHFEEK